MTQQRAGWVSLLGGLIATLGLLAGCGGGGGSGEGAGGAISAPVVSLWAGSWQTPGSKDGPAETAQFLAPDSVVHDAAGNAYISDSRAHTVRKLSLDGQVSTLAGLAGEAGSSDGAGPSARFNSPSGLAIDTKGFLYVADAGNHTIRKISPSGQVSTLAGVVGEGVETDGDRATARFASPRRLAWDPVGGALYVAGKGLRKIAPDGQVTTPIQAACSYITSVAVDTVGQIFVAESPISGLSGGISSGCVRKFSSQAQAIPWGADADGFVRVPYPQALAVDRAGNVWAGGAGFAALSPNFSTLIGKIIRISSEGAVSTVLGVDNDRRVVDGPLSTARAYAPMGISVAPGGQILFTEPDYSALRQINGQNVRTVSGGSGTGDTDGAAVDARFFDISGFASAADGSLYVSDTGNQKIRRISVDGVVSSVAKLGFRPGSLAIDSKSVVYIAQPKKYLYDWNMIQALDGAGGLRALDPATPSLALLAMAPGDKLLALMDPTGAGARTELSAYDPSGKRSVLVTGLMGAQGVVADAAGRIVLADTGAKVLRVVDYAGNVSVLAGQPGLAGKVDGTGDQARFTAPSALAVDPYGNVYVLDDATLRVVSPQGTVRTLVAENLGSVGGLAWSAGALYARTRTAVLRISPIN